MRSSTYLRVLEHVIHRIGRGAPPLLFEVELASTCGGDFARTRAAILLGRDLPGLDPARLLHAMESRVQRALLHAEHVRETLNVRRNGVAVERPPSVQDRENEERQRALERI